MQDIAESSWKKYAQKSLSILKKEDVLLSIVLVEVVLLVLLSTSFISPLASGKLGSVLQLIVTISGITGGLIFGFLVRGYYDAQGQVHSIMPEIEERHRKLTIFREMCNWSTSSHRVWSALHSHPNEGKTGRLSTDVLSDEEEENLSYGEGVKRIDKLSDEEFDQFTRRDKNQYAYFLYRALMRLSDGVYGTYHKFPEGKKLYTYEKIDELKEDVNTVWYFTGGDSKYRTVKEFLERSEIREARLTERVFLADYHKEAFGYEVNAPDFPTLNDWYHISGDVFLLCDEIQSLYREVYGLSPQHYLKKYRRAPLFVTVGVLLPLILLMFEYDIAEPFYSFLAYVCIILFLGVLIPFGLSIRATLKEDFYTQFIEKHDPQNISRL